MQNFSVNQEKVFYFGDVSKQTIFELSFANKIATALENSEARELFFLFVKDQ